MTPFRPLVIEGKEYRVTLTIEAKDPGRGFRLIHRFRRWLPWAIAKAFGVTVEEAQPCNCGGS